MSISSSQLLIAGIIRGTSMLPDITSHIGIASVAISNFSILELPVVHTLNGQIISKPSRFNGSFCHVSSSIDLFTRSNPTQQAKQIIVKQLSVNSSNTRFSLLLSSGDVYSFEIATMKRVSSYPPAKDSNVSEVSSLEGLSVIHPVSLTTVCWCGWWDDQTLCISTYQGDVGILCEGEGEWMMFNPGVLVACGVSQSNRFLLVVDSSRRWMKGVDKDIVVSDTSVLTVRQVSAIEKYHHCIETKEYGIATSIAKRYGFDLDEL